MNLLVDACLSPRTAERLKNAGPDVVHAASWGQAGPDRGILIRANAEHRTVITLDKDFGELVVREGLPHCGVVRLVDVSVEEQADLCEKALHGNESALASGAIVTATAHRVRVRLPPHIRN